MQCCDVLQCEWKEKEEADRGRKAKMKCACFVCLFCIISQHVCECFQFDYLLYMCRQTATCSVISLASLLYIRNQHSSIENFLLNGLNHSQNLHKHPTQF